MHRWIRRPGKQEQTNREYNRTCHGRTQSGFWLDYASPCLDLRTETHVAFIVHAGRQRGKTDANGDADKRKSSSALAPTSRNLEDDGKPGKEHVQCAIDDRDVQRCQQDNRFAEQKDPGACERDGELLRECLGRLSCIEPGHIDASCHLGEGLGSTSQNEGCVCFVGGQHRGNADHPAQYGDQTEIPAPALGLAKETTGNGP